MTIKNNRITMFIGFTLIIGSIIAFIHEKNKSDRLTAIECEVLSFDCIGRGAHTMFLYKNQKRTIGGSPDELCKENKNSKSIILYHYAEDDTFYYTNNTFSNRYLMLTGIGILICFVPYFSKKLDDFLFEKDLKKSRKK
ncbi:hypothetical protein E6C50_17455 [Flavobacterium supellecticarium]|uniref:Uncharacterized protein n=1 Tax=Flavobacterium supellecticarium TaxID=2565924 RepID=A0A4S3ZNU1_9FLAO|nr:hypothetical protein [Flavobacterium supellecticarium]THF47084.1 hypothetical protein E6C50_17455 [Flavobacterium supellecticarium]